MSNSQMFLKASYEENMNVYKSWQMSHYLVMLMIKFYGFMQSY